MTSLPPSLPASGTDIDKIIGSTHNLFVVLYHYHGVAQLLQLSQYLDESVGITAMESDTWLVEDIHAAHERRTEAGGQVDALALSSRKGVGETVEGEIAKSYIQKELQAIGNLGQESLAHFSARVLSAPASGTMR